MLYYAAQQYGHRAFGDVVGAFDNQEETHEGIGKILSSLEMQGSWWIPWDGLHRARRKELEIGLPWDGMVRRRGH